MKQIANILLLMSVLTVQTLDIGLDLGNDAIEEIHTALGIDSNQPIADHDIHCGCDMFHHMANSLGNDSNSIKINRALVFNGLAKQFNDQNTGPPVPPPLA